MSDRTNASYPQPNEIFLPMFQDYKEKDLPKIPGDVTKVFALLQTATNCSSSLLAVHLYDLDSSVLHRTYSSF